MNNEVTIREKIREKNVREFREKTYALQEALRATEKQVKIQIGEEDLQKLKKEGYSLCFAKKVGDFDYDVIWKSMKKYLVNNIFSWRPIYQIFGTNTFEDEVKVEVSTNTKNIGIGEKTILDESGLLSEPVTGGNKNAINVDNEYGDIHFAIAQVSVNENGGMETTPIYVSKEASIKGDASFKPVEKILVWFQSNAQTSTMFAEMRSNAMEVDLTNRSEAAIRYEDGIWSVI